MDVTFSDFSASFIVVQNTITSYRSKGGPSDLLMAAMSLVHNNNTQGTLTAVAHPFPGSSRDFNTFQMAQHPPFSLLTVSLLLWSWGCIAVYILHHPSLSHSGPLLSISWRDYLIVVAKSVFSRSLHLRLRCIHAHLNTQQTSEWWKSSQHGNDIHVIKHTALSASI